MNSEVPQQVFDEIRELAVVVASGHATAEQFQRLELLARHSDHTRREYLRQMHETLVLCRWARGAPWSRPSRYDLTKMAECSQPTDTPSSLEALVNHTATHDSRTGIVSRRCASFGWRQAQFAAAGALALVLSVLGVVAGHWLSGATCAPAGGRPLDLQRVARIVRASDAVWECGGVAATLSSGDWLMNGRYSLRQGIAQIVFPWGTEVTLEAPSEIEFTPEGARRLWHGQLVAKVSPEDAGFTIDTPTVKVIDLGTEFGLSTAPNGESEVHVFKGAVEARPHFADQAASQSSITLLTGEANGFATKDAPVRQIAFNPKRFSRAWKLSSRVAETSGAMRFMHPPPASVAEGQTESNENLLLFLEAEAVKLPEALAVTATEPGLRTAFAGHCTWLPPGLEIDSYLLHFDPVGSQRDQAPVTVRGTATFDRPILGVIARGDQLAASDDVLAFPGTQYVSPATYLQLHSPSGEEYLVSHRRVPLVRGLTGLWYGIFRQESPAPNDWFSLSPDRRTLTVKCTAGIEPDQLRVLVAASDEITPAVPDPSRVRSSRPYRGYPFEVEETIEAEDFDLGGDGIAYYDATPDILASVYRTNESVELYGYMVGENTSAVVCGTRAGEWLAYTVDIAEPGTYVISARVASSFGDSLFRFDFGSTVSAESLRVPHTRDAQSRSPQLFQTIESKPVWLAAGRQIMRVVMEKNHKCGYIGDFDWFRIERVEDDHRTLVVPAEKSTPTE